MVDFLFIEGDFEETEEGEYILDDQAATEGNSKEFFYDLAIPTSFCFTIFFFLYNFRSWR